MDYIVQGEQYKVPVIVKRGNVIFTNENVTGMRIALGNSVYTYPNGDLTFENGAWQIPLTQKQSYALEGGKADFQVQVKLGTDIVSIPKKTVTIEESMFKGEW